MARREHHARELDQSGDGWRRFERLAEQLALHALTEEEVLYPAAVLVGEVMRARLGTR